MTGRFVYLQDACRNVFNGAGIPLAGQVLKMQGRIRDVQLKYMRKYPWSMVVFDIFQRMTSRGLYVYLTEKQIDRLGTLLIKHNPGVTAQVQACMKMAKTVAIGKKYTDTNVLTTEGKLVKLSALMPQSKYILLDFWGAHCGPCREAIPHLKHVYSQYKDKGFEIVGVSLDWTQKDWHKALEVEQMPWLQVRDPADGRRGTTPLIEAFHVYGTPCYLLLDGKGRIIQANLTDAYLDSALRKLLGAPVGK